MHRYTLLYKIDVYIELISYVCAAYVCARYILAVLSPPTLLPSLPLSLQGTLEEASAPLKEIEARDSHQISSQTSTDNKQQSCDTSNELSSNSQDCLEG